MCVRVREREREKERERKRERGRERETKYLLGCIHTSGFSLNGSASIKQDGGFDVSNTLQCFSSIYSKV